MADDEDVSEVSTPEEDEPFYDESDQPVWRNLGDH